MKTRKELKIEHFRVQKEYQYDGKDLEFCVQAELHSTCGALTEEGSD